MRVKWQVEKEVCGPYRGRQAREQMESRGSSVSPAAALWTTVSLPAPSQLLPKETKESVREENLSSTLLGSIWGPVN